jgi:microcin C transport system permease protein
MWKYLLKRILVMMPTLFGIVLFSFLIINLAPGGPIEQKLQQIRYGAAMGGEGGLSGGKGGGNEAEVSQDVIDALNKQYGFDKPVLVRFGIWLKNIATLNFGDSFVYERPVTEVIASKFPVSMQFGILSFILTYLICIPLGVMKAVRAGTAFDSASSFILFILYSVPPIMLGVLLMVFFAGGSYYNWFPSKGMVSDAYDTFTNWGKFTDRVHHFILPLICYMINGFTTLTMLMKNSMLDEIQSDYVRTARAKGLSERIVIYKHALRNALIPLVTGIGGFLGVFLAGSLLIEQLFSLDGIGLLGFSAAMARDYNVLMALIFISSVVTLIGRLISDLLYLVVDPRIDFNE